MREGKQSIKGLFFDWDGTILDSAQAMLLSFRYSYQKHLGIFFPKDETDFRMLVPMRVAESSALFGKEHAAELANSYTWYYENEAYKTGRVFSAVRETCTELKRRGYRLGVASNKSWGRIRADIEFLELDGLVQVFVTSEDTVERKPHPAPLLKLAEKLELASQSCAYIGDYSGDIVAAKAAGMVSIAVLWGGIFLPETLQAEHPDHVVARPEQLLDIFPDLNSK